jgi:cell division protein FtsN
MWLLEASSMGAKNKRRVVIGEGEDRGVRYGRFPQGTNEALGPVKHNHPNKSGRIIVPTHDRRHMTKFRLGVLDTTTVFSRQHREALTVDPDVKLEQDAASRKAAEEALAALTQEEVVAEKPKRKRATKKKVTKPKAAKKDKPKPKAKKKAVTKPKAKAPVKRKPVKRKVSK